MNKLGRIFCIVLTIATALTVITSCGNNEPNETGDPSGSSGNQSEITEPSQPKEGLSLSESAVTLATGSTVQLTAISLTTGNPTANVTWKSENPEIATVSAKGEIKGVSDGTTKVSATSLDERYAVSCTVTVSSRPTGIALSQTEIKLGVGKAATLTASLIPENTGVQPNFIWESTVPSVVTVDANGNLTALRKGTASITVRYGELYAICNVTVMVAPTGLTLGDSELEMDAGTGRKLTWTVTPVDATCDALTFTSSDEAIASVDADGTVHAHAKGEAVITVAVSDTLSAQCKVTVKESVQSLTISQEALTLELGGVATLVADVVPAGISEIFWISSNPEVVTVDSQGGLTALKVGVSEVSAQTIDGKTATCVVTVVNNLVSISFESSEITLAKGNKHQLNPIILPETHKDSYTWKTSDHLVVQVSSKGLLTAKGLGTATVTVTGASGITASIIVHVEKQVEIVDVTEIKIDQVTVEVREGEFADILATVLPDNATDKTVTFRILSSNNSSVKIKDGKVFGVRASTGYVRVQAVSANGVKSNEVLVKVTPISDSVKKSAVSEYKLAKNKLDSDNKNNLSAVDLKYKSEIDRYQIPLESIGLTEASYRAQLGSLEKERADYQAEYDKAHAEGNAQAAADAQTKLNKVNKEIDDLGESWQQVQLLQKQLDAVQKNKKAEIDSENARYQSELNALNEEYDYIIRYL